MFNGFQGLRYHCGRTSISFCAQDFPSCRGDLGLIQLIPAGAVEADAPEHSWWEEWALWPKGASRIGWHGMAWAEMLIVRCDTQRTDLWRPITFDIATNVYSEFK